MAVETGDLILVNYKGTLEDEGETYVFDSTYEQRGPNKSGPFEFRVGDESVISGFSDNVLGMEAGQQRTFTVTPDQAFGARDDNLIRVLSRDDLPGEPVLGTKLDMVSPDGSTRMHGLITDISDEQITVDLNHPLSGFDLTYEVQLLKILEKREEREA